VRELLGKATMVETAEIKTVLVEVEVLAQQATLKADLMVATAAMGWQTQ
jgi:hypothetical protein